MVGKRITTERCLMMLTRAFHSAFSEPKSAEQEKLDEVPASQETAPSGRQTGFAERSVPGETGSVTNVFFMSFTSFLGA